jgi:solute carrier family 13 (sodium-dependent dicarboxylate transporter), member 2/3/5
VDAHNAFDVWRARVGAILAPSVACIIIVVGEGGPKTHLSALFAATAILWVSEAVPVAVTALVAVAMSVVLGIATAKDAFMAMGNPILFLFVGSFMIAEAMNLHGLGARFARAMTRHAKGRLGALMATSGAAFLMSMWMSNAAATAVVLPIALQIARSVNDKRYSAATVLSIAWAASMGGIATPVGTPPNLIGMRALTDASMSVDFFSWMKVGLPISCLMLVAMWLVLAGVFRVRPGVAAPPVVEGKPAWSRGEVAAFVAFMIAVIGWIVPGLLDAAGSDWGDVVKKRIPEEVVALLAAAVLFVWPISRDGKRALSWEDAARIDWGTVLLFGGGILLGDLANKTGLAKDWGASLMQITGAGSTFAVVAIVTLASLVLSELASNTASATLMVPLAFALAQSTGTPPIPAVLAASIGASFGFMMPISTAPNAMAYATKLVTVRQMLMAGIVFDVVGYVAVVAGITLLWPLIAP